MDGSLNPTHDIYQSSLRPARGLGEGLDRRTPPVKASSARKLPDNPEPVHGSGHRPPPGQTAPGSTTSARLGHNSNTGSGGNFRPFPRAVRVARKSFGNDRNAYEDHGDDDRWQRGLLPPPTYSLRRSAVRGARKHSMLVEQPASAAGHGESGVSGARKLAQKSVRFLQDLSDTTHIDPRHDVSSTRFNRPVERHWPLPRKSSVNMRRNTLSSTQQRYAPPYREAASSSTPSRPRFLGTPAGQNPATSNNPSTPRNVQIPRIHQTKSAPVVTPRWHAQDTAQKSGTAYDTPHQRMGKSFMASRQSISSISAIGSSGARRDEDSNVLKADEVTKARVWYNMRVKVEGEDSDLEMDEGDLDISELRSAARKDRFGSGAHQRAIIIDSDGSASNEELPEDSLSGSESPNVEGPEEDEPEALLSNLEDDFDSLYFRRPSTPLVDEGSESVHEPSEELVGALESLALPSLQMQRAGRLPFLLRGLRRGFKDRCRLVGVPTRQDDHTAVSLNVIYKYEVGNEDGRDAMAPQPHEYQTRANSWLCPICELHGRFKTREMLAKHLEWDHPEVTCSWQETRETWRIILTLPHPPKVVERRTEPPIEYKRPGILSLHSAPLSVLDAVVPLERPQSQVKDEAVVPNEEWAAAAAEQTEITPQLQDDKHSLSQSPSRATSQARTQIIPTPPTTSAEPTPGTSESSTTPFKPPSASPPPTNHSSTSRTRSNTAASSSIRQISTPLPVNYPPPPADDPLGPSIRYPYLPAIWEGFVPVYFSCRPGGPRLYDLLNALPMEEFGVLSWYIIDKEEEIFECDDVKDEDKVMQALWARWILLNRNYFVANYFKGTIAFINQYWLMIHRAAGWAALRDWLLVLIINRFLTGAEVAKVLRHYESHTGMDYWCKIVPSDIPTDAP